MIPSWGMFDVKTLSPLSANEQAEIETACTGFVQHFNSGLDERSKVQWSASPLDLDGLDYDFYEFGGANWYRDNGYGFTCAYGQILVTSFGFQWMKMAGAQNLRDWVLQHDEAFYVFFPWQTLWSIVESSGNQFTKARGVWLQILAEVDSVNSLPTGWYPPMDVMSGQIASAPAKVVSELEILYDRSPNFFELLGTLPYTWSQDYDWDRIFNHLKLQRMESR